MQISFFFFFFFLSSIVEMYDIKKMTHSMICVTQCGVYLREIINEFVRCSWMWGVCALLVFSAVGFIDLLVSGFYRSSQLWALLISVLNFTDLLSSGLYWSSQPVSIRKANTYQKQNKTNKQTQTKTKPRIKQQRKTKTKLLTCLQLYVSQFCIDWFIFCSLH